MATKTVQIETFTMGERQIVRVETCALLRLKCCVGAEWHLTAPEGRWPNPLNLVQRLSYWIMWFEYVYGAAYIELMTDRINAENDRRIMESGAQA